jgi:DNA polymerase elongation subunit (family B)
MTLEQIYEKIEDGSMTVDEINNMDLTHLKGSDTSHIESRSAYWDTYQLALKISMNSLYGALANTYFLLFNRDVAASITGNGRIFIQGLANYINDKLRRVLNTNINFVVYGDTDSVYFTLDELVKKFEKEDNHEILNKLINFDHKYLDKWVQEYIDLYSDNFNAFNSEPIGAKLEKIADKGMFVAKKKYALRAIWDEGSILVDDPYLAVTGLEIVRSSTPTFCRKYLKEMVNIILDNDAKTTIEKLGALEQLFYEAPLSDIARVSGIGSLDYEGHIGRYTKWKNDKTLTAPMNVRAAMNFNLFVETTGLTKYPQILVSDKIKYIFLKKPNILGDDVIAFLDEDFIEDSGLSKYVDKERMWTDFFIAPMKIMLEAVGYDLNQNFDMEEWLV